MELVRKIKEFLFKNYLEKKLYMIGCSHVLSMRSKYENISNISDVDFKIYSQNGEDGILDYLLTRLNIQRPKFLEIGVGDYSESNTRFIFERTSAKGTIIDCIEDLEIKVRKRIKLWKGDLSIINEKINSNNILDILYKKNNFKDIDLFSLDIDGVDYWILEKLPPHFSKVAILEYNPTFGYNLEISVPNILEFDRTKYHHSNLCFGMSFKAAVNLMKRKGFYFVGSNLLRNNAFFISDKYEKNKFFKNLVIDESNQNVDSNFRESRDINNELTYLTGKKKIEQILDCKVVDLSNLENTIFKLKDISNLI